MCRDVSIFAETSKNSSLVAGAVLAATSEKGPSPGGGVLARLSSTFLGNPAQLR